MWRGRLITVDDSMITLMDVDGRVRFIPSSAVRSRTLCPEAEQVPSSVVYVQAGTPRTPRWSGWRRSSDRPNPTHDVRGGPCGPSDSPAEPGARRHRLADHDGIPPPGDRPTTIWQLPP